MLSDETLGSILSFLTLKEAVQTSTLSRQWRHTWTLTRKLDLDGTATLKEMKNSLKLHIDGAKATFFQEIGKLMTPSTSYADKEELALNEERKQVP